MLPFPLLPPLPGEGTRDRPALRAPAAIMAVAVPVCSCKISASTSATCVLKYLLSSRSLRSSERDFAAATIQKHIVTLTLLSRSTRHDTRPTHLSVHTTHGQRTFQCTRHTANEPFSAHDTRPTNLSVHTTHDQRTFQCTRHTANAPFSAHDTRPTHLSVHTTHDQRTFQSPQLPL
jgi:hypothetical protein